MPSLALDVLSPTEAVELLESAGSDVREREITEVLAERLGHLPLALEVVGALASLPGASSEDLLAELHDPLALVEQAASNPFASTSATEHSLSLAETFGPSLRRLDSKSVAVLIVGAALNVGPLPTGVVRAVAKAVMGVRAQSFSYAIGMLLSRSLARRVDSETVEVHALVAAAALEWNTTSEATQHACYDAAAVELVAELGDIEDIGTHAETRRLATFGEALALSPRHGGDDRQEGALLHSLGRFMHVEARFNEAIILERRAAALAGKRFQEDPRGALNAQLNLGLTLHNAGAAEGEELVRAALSQLEAQFGPEDLDVLTAKHNLASWSRSTEDARVLGRQVFEARRRLLGPDHPHTLFSLHTLLSVDVLPEPYTDFEAAYRDLIARRTKVLGPDHTTTLTSVTNFVERLVRLDRPDAAVPLGRLLVERRAALYGVDHPATLRAKSVLLLALSALPVSPMTEISTLAQDLEAALEVLRPYEEVYVLGAIDGLSNGCVALQRHGRADLAVHLAGRALPKVVNRLGPTDRRTLILEHNLAAAFAARGDLEVAHDQFEDILERMRQSLDANDRLMLRAQRQQSLIEARLGRFPEALDEQIRLAQLWEDRAGSASAELAEALGDIADTLERAGETSRADDYRERQHAIASATEAASANWV
jgi:tetratricopeptide (TPR) repeat protein